MVKSVTRVRSDYTSIKHFFPPDWTRHQSARNLGYPFNKIYQHGYAQVQPANPNLKWETDYQTDIGMDAAFLHGNLTLTVDWFNRKSKDFLLTLAAPAQTGYNFITRNVGSMNKKGIEVRLNYSHQRQQGFSLQLGLNVYSNQNKLTSLTSGTNFVSKFWRTDINRKRMGRLFHKPISDSL